MKNKFEMQVTCAEARAKIVEDELAKERAEMQEKITKEENEIIEVAMYRIWSANQDAAISFMGDVQENLLARWKARWQEEYELLASITVSEAVVWMKMVAK